MDKLGFDSESPQRSSATSPPLPSPSFSHFLFLPLLFFHYFSPFFFSFILLLPHPPSSSYSSSSSLILLLPLLPPLFLLTQTSQMLYVLHSETGLWRGPDKKKLRPLVSGRSHMSNLDPTAVTQASEVCSPS